MRKACKAFSKSALAKGARIEKKEHPWASKATARRIAGDHLCEKPSYYAREQLHEIDLRSELSRSELHQIAEVVVRDYERDRGEKLPAQQRKVVVGSLVATAEALYGTNYKGFRHKVDVGGGSASQWLKANMRRWVRF